MKPDDWKRKNAAYLHDPPLKHDALYYRGVEGRGHRAYASRLAALLGDEADDPHADAQPDRWTASADRAQLGHGGMVKVRWRSRGLVTHPLDEAPLSLLPEAARAGLAPRETLAHMADRLNKLVDGAVAGRGVDDRAQAAFYALWRGLDDALAAERPAGVEAEVWERYARMHPSDTRSPDHSLRDHLRLSSALALVGDGEPYLFRFTIGPVGAWIRASRTSRDLWTASVLLSELSFAALRVVVDRYGPDAVVYPDLAFNGRMDRHLAQPGQYPDLLPDAARTAKTRAALVPNSWLAVVPEGEGERHIRRLGPDCRAAALSRWTELAAAVRSEFLRAMGPILSAEELAATEARWTQQCEAEDELRVHFAALLWKEAAELEVPPQPPNALPFMPAPDPSAKERRRRFLPYVDSVALARYDRAAWVFQRTWKQAGWGIRAVPGQDYAPTWHLLHRALEARKLSQVFATRPGEASTVCTVCGHRDALGAPAGGSVDAQRATTRAYWEKVGREVNSDAGGAERLCGVCATRRFLIPPWKVPALKEGAADAWTEFHRVWSSPADHGADGKLRLPMPSTAAVAAAPWLAAVLGSGDKALDRCRQDVSKWAERNRWPQTFFARGLSGVARVADPKDRFTELEPSILFAGPREAELAARDAQLTAPLSESARDRQDAERRDLADAVKRLIVRAEDLGIPRPSARFAVLAIDGDQLGDLILGESTRIGATWAQVLHPDVVAQLRQRSEAGEEWASLWQVLLGEPRLMGPSLHAFINRAVTTFASTMVPWVVEQEFNGRLVYAGGDDILALAPADEALGIAARLQQLWSAAWVLDTTPERQPWPDRLVPESIDERRERFRILVAARGEVIDPTEPLFAPHAWTGLKPKAVKRGRLVPMLGRYQSLSAGIAYAHFKTPLGLVVAEAKRALEEDAKDRADRRACAEVLYTRGGPKHRSVFRWEGGPSGDRPMVPAVRRVRELFADGTLPKRLPSKLAEGMDGARLLYEAPDLYRRWIRGLLARGMEGTPSDEQLDMLVDLWAEGIQATVIPDRPRDRSGRLSPSSEPRDPPGLGNLLICRALAGDEDDA